MEQLTEILKEVVIQNKREHFHTLEEFEFQLTQMEKLISRTKIETSILQAKGEIADTLINQFFEKRRYLCESLEKALGEAIDRTDSETAEVVLRVLEVLYSGNVFEKINDLI